ncbi:mCG114030 [Mus musculus]|nr:mCG114030 [Mus musculus]
MFSRLLRLFHRENGDQGETRPRQKESGILSCKKGRMKSFWGRHMSAGRTSSQSCNITNHMNNMNKLDDMKFYIRKINAEREELFQILEIDMNTDLNYRMNTEFTIIKSQHEKTMLDMEKMKQSISDSIDKYKEFLEDNDSYSIRHTHLLKECNQLKEKVRMLLNENRKLLVEQADQEASFGEEKRFCDETSKNIHPKCKAAAGRMMCIRGRLPSWLTINIDNPM